MLLQPRRLQRVCCCHRSRQLLHLEFPALEAAERLPLLLQRRRLEAAARPRCRLLLRELLLARHRVWAVQWPLVLQPLQQGRLGPQLPQDQLLLALQVGQSL